MKLRYSARTLIFLGVLLCSFFATAESQAAKTVYILRGGGGYFPNLGNIVNKNYNSRGLTVVDFRVDQQEKAIKEITSAYKARKLHGGIHLVGYSAGGPAVINIAHQLGRDGIPVRLVVLIETVRPGMAIPSNVKGCFNLKNATARPVKAVSPSRTKVFNCEARKDAGFGPEYGHFRIPWVDGVHEMIAEEVLNAMAGRAPGRTIPARKAANLKMRESTTTKKEDSKKAENQPEKEKKPAMKNPFEGLFKKKEPSDA